MAEPDDSAFSRVLSAFRSRLSQQNIGDFQFTTFEDLKNVITKIQTEQAQRRSLRNLNKIRPLLNGLEQYSKVIEVFVNAKPDIMSFVWVSNSIPVTVPTRYLSAYRGLSSSVYKYSHPGFLYLLLGSLFPPATFMFCNGLTNSLSSCVAFTWEL